MASTNEIYGAVEDVETLAATLTTKLELSNEESHVFYRALIDAFTVALDAMSDDDAERKKKKKKR